MIAWEKDQSLFRLPCGIYRSSGKWSHHGKIIREICLHDHLCGTFSMVHLVKRTLDHLAESVRKKRSLYVDGTATERAESSDESCYKEKSPVVIVTKQSWAVEMGSGSGGQRRKKHCRLLSPVFFSLSQIIVAHPQPTHYRGQLCGSSGGMRVLCRRGRGGGVDFRMLPACLNPPPLPLPLPPHPPLLLRPPEGTSGSVGRPQGCRPPMCWTFSNATARLPLDL